MSKKKIRTVEYKEMLERMSLAVEKTCRAIELIEDVLKELKRFNKELENVDAWDFEYEEKE